MAKILLVDDERLNVELLRARLEPRGYELFEAESGEAAIEQSRRVAPDLVLLDVQMPGMGGLEACRRLKQEAHGRGDYLPIVLVTALDDLASRRMGFEAGADDFLGKPFDVVELGLRIRNSLARRADRLVLQQQNAQLQQLQHFKDEMSALLVHDLKNPAAVVIANLEFIETGLGDDTPKEALVEAIDDALDACRRSLKMLGNLLDVARAEDNRLDVHREPTALVALIEPLVRDRQLSAKQRGLVLDAELDRSAIAPIDGDLVGRILENVLDNALRYTPRGGLIHLTLRVVDDFVQIRIGNTGKAIPIEARASIFEKYGQADSPANHLNKGLGLYFCRMAAEAHGGRIWVEEEPALPTVFVLSLPTDQNAHS